jgi:hypothetical protein
MANEKIVNMKKRRKYQFKEKIQKTKSSPEIRGVR